VFLILYFLKYFLDTKTLKHNFMKNVHVLLHLKAIRVLMH